jgi:hypothetical protein
MKLQNQCRAQLERTFPILHVGADHLKRDCELSEPVLRLSTRNFVRVT